MMLSPFRKLCLLFLAAMVMTTAASAQVQFGIKSGLNVSELLTSTDQNIFVGGNPQAIRNFPKVQVNAGFLFSIPLSPKYTFQPEVVFSEQGATGKPTNEYLVSATEEYQFNYLNVPLLLKYNLPLGFFAETGPQVGLLLTAEITQTVVGATNQSFYHVKGQLKSTDFSWVLGGGFLTPINLGFDIRYNLGLISFNNATASDMQNAPLQDKSLKNGVLQLGVFYLFGKIKEPAGPKID